jgi:polyphosphate glucokinase
MDVLVIDVGGTGVKILASGQTEHRKFASGRSFTPDELIAGVMTAAEGWHYDVISIGVPGPVRNHRVVKQPPNLGAGWVDFDFAAAFHCPVKVLNDAAMQALGSYDGGRMLFLGLGTGLGSAMVIEGVVQPMELGHLPFRKRTFEEYVGIAGFEEFGKKAWRADVAEVVAILTAALQPDYVVLGGGNIKRLKDLPPGTRAGDNANAFRGGFRLWDPATPPS